MPALIHAVTWGALFGAIFMTCLCALRFIIYGDLSDILCMTVSVVCLVILVAAVTA
jgi:hypothetical protein